MNIKSHNIDGNLSFFRWDCIFYKKNLYEIKYYRLFFVHIKKNLDQLLGMSVDMGIPVPIYIYICVKKSYV